MDDTPCTPPDDSQLAIYTMSTLLYPDADDRAEEAVTVARSGNDFYFSGLFPDVPEMMFRGTLDDKNRIIVEVPQFMGYSKLGEPIYLYCAYHRRDITASQPTYYYEVTDSKMKLRLNYDAETGNITSSAVMCTAAYGTKKVVKGVDWPSWTVGAPADIEDIEHSTFSIRRSVYDLQGRQLSGKRSGLNIVRMADGSVRKVMVR